MQIAGRDERARQTPYKWHSNTRDTRNFDLWNDDLCIACRKRKQKNRIFFYIRLWPAGRRRIFRWHCAKSLLPMCSRAAVTVTNQQHVMQSKVKMPSIKLRQKKKISSSCGARTHLSHRVYNLPLAIVLVLLWTDVVCVRCPCSGSCSIVKH